MMSRWLPIAVVLAFVIVSGIVHGVWTSRWSSSRNLEESVERVFQVPLQIGNWKGKDLEVDPKPYAKAGARAYWMRRYDNAVSGESISVILMCGRSGPISAHTPELCYTGVGFNLYGGKKKIDIGNKTTSFGTFWTGNFTRGKSSAPNGLRLFWAWNVSGSWQAPVNARFSFRGQAALYKLYVIREFDSVTEPVDTDPAVRFLRILLPGLKKTLFPSPTAD